MTTKRLFRQIHLWLSVPFGIILTLICFSGAALVFETEITEALRSDLYTTHKPAPDARPLPISQLARRVAATLPDSVRLTGVSIAPDDAGRTYLFNLSKPRRAAVAVDPYTGEVRGRTSRLPFFATMFSLHRWLLDGMKPGGGMSVGKLVVGISTLAFVFVLISGIVVWWPRTRRALTESLRLKFGPRRFHLWHSLHVAGGMYALIFLLAMALTGLTWSFGWYRTGFYALFGIEQPTSGGHGAPAVSDKGRDGNGEKGDGKKNGDGKNGRKSRGDKQPERAGHSDAPAAQTGFSQWQKVYETLASHRPDARLITVGDGMATVASARYGNTRATDRYTYDPATGRITEAALYADAKPAAKMRGWIFAVHTGSFGGIVTRILAFAAALLGATLPLTGYYLWLRRLHAKRRRRRN